VTQQGVIFSIYTSPEIHHELKDWAKTEHRTVSNLIVHLLEPLLAQRRLTDPDSPRSAPASGGSGQ